MALSGTMQCFKICGTLCGMVSVLNIWFWLGMTLFSAMGNTYLSFGFAGFPLGETDKQGTFTMIYGVVALVSSLSCCQFTGWFLFSLYLPVLVLLNFSWMCFAALDVSDASSWTAIKTKMRSSITGLRTEPTSVLTETSAKVWPRNESMEVTMIRTTSQAS